MSEAGPNIGLDTVPIAGLDSGAIAGIVIGCVVGLILIILLIIWVARRFGRKEVVQDKPKEAPKHDDSMMLEHRPALGHRSVAKLTHNKSGQKRSNNKENYGTEEISNYKNF